MDKETLLQEIEQLLSFDGNAIAIHPDYLHYFTVEQLENIKNELTRKQTDMVEEHREWMKRFASCTDPSDR
ncbi:MAG: hypothetical protein GXO33_07000 [Epsilonproteobacteria bacterium]|nr:hypothetical protein [Campylobacterota bacterium]